MTWKTRSPRRWRECGWTRTMIEEVLELVLHGLRCGVWFSVACVVNIYMTHTKGNGEVNVTN